VQGIIGLFIAMAQNLIPDSIIPCVFDELYPHLVPVPFAPSQGLYALEASYTTWEG